MAVDQGAGGTGLARRVRWRHIVRWVPVATLVVGGLVLAAWVLWVVLGPGAAAWWLEHVDGITAGDKDGLSDKDKDLAEALDAVRSRAMTFGTGLLAAAAIYFTASNARSARSTAQAAQENVAAAQRAANAAHRSAEIAEEGQRRTLELTEQGQVTGRYTAAIEQLGSDKLDIRLGGIYALQRIARDSSRDHPTVMAVLAAFVREHSHDPDAQGEIADGNEDRPVRSRLRPDLQAGLTVLARRDTDHDTDRIDLVSANLTDATLAYANLVRADLTGANLTDATLDGATLAYANLTGATLTDANLTDANLVRADLTGANLVRADLTGATLDGADLTGATLDGANLAYANLTGAVWSDDTVWPDSVGGADGMRARSEPAGEGWPQGTLRVRDA